MHYLATPNTDIFHPFRDIGCRPTSNGQPPHADLRTSLGAAVKRHKMARTRSLKPAFFTNEDLAGLPFGARLMYAGLWTIADRDGRLEDRPKRIKAQIFPHDSVDAEKLLEQLAGANFIVRYAVDSNRFIAIPTFLKHQHPHHREPASLIPAPGQPQASPGNVGPGRASTPEPSLPISSTPEPQAPPAPGLAATPETVGALALVVAEPDPVTMAIEECEVLYARAGKPIPERHRNLAVQYLLGIRPDKLPRIANYIRWALASGTWSDPAHTKGFLNLLRDGDWDVQITMRTLPATPQNKSRGQLAQDEATRRFLKKRGAL